MSSMQEREESTPGPRPVTTESASQTPQESPEKPKRSRRGRKRTRFAMPPRPAQSVKALWEQASAEDRERAHLYGMAILETWLGKKSRQDAASELGLPVLRIWQLSQQALSGMLAGLLIQPRTRRSPSMPKPSPEDDPVELRKTIAKLEKELRIANELIEVLKLIPDRPPAPPEPKPTKKKRTQRPARKAQAAGGKRRRRASPPAGNADAGGAASSGAEA